jgi:CHAT domain-containing protein
VSDKASFFLMLRFRQILLDNPTRTPAWILREAVKWLRTATWKDLDEMLNISGVRLNTLIECMGVRGVSVDQLSDGLRGISLKDPIKKNRQIAQFDAPQQKYAQSLYNENNIPFAHPIYWASTMIYGS